MVNIDIKFKNWLESTTITGIGIPPTNTTNNDDGEDEYNPKWHKYIKEISKWLDKKAEELSIPLIKIMIESGLRQKLRIIQQRNGNILNINYIWMVGRNKNPETMVAVEETLKSLLLKSSLREIFLEPIDLSKELEDGLFDEIHHFIDRFLMREVPKTGTKLNLLASDFILTSFKQNKSLLEATKGYIPISKTMTIKYLPTISLNDGYSFYIQQQFIKT